jgi:ureidoacrylate peracid hydrolase
VRAETTAIVFQGLQRDFCAPGGRLYPLLEREIVSRGVVPKLLTLIERAREAGVRCYFVPIEFSPDYREIARAQGILGAIRDAGALTRGSPGARPIPELEPLLGAVTTVTAKRGLCAFGTTPLDEILRSTRVNTVAVCGLLTNVCVETTARSAYDLGYEVITLAEATATKTPEEQAASEQHAFPLLGRTLTIDAFFAGLAGDGADMNAGVLAPDHA